MLLLAVHHHAVDDVARPLASRELRCLLQTAAQEPLAESSLARVPGPDLFR